MRIIDKPNLTIEGDGALLFTDDPRPNQYATTLRYPYRNRYHVSIEGGNNITLRNLKIRGAHPNGGTSSNAYVVSLEAQHGINIYSTQGATIEGCEISDVYGDFVYVGYQKGVWASNITIRGNKMERNGRQGIAITGGDKVLIENNEIQDVRRSVFDLEANGVNGGATNITIRGNRVGAKRLTWLANDGQGSNIRNIVIDNNYSTTGMNILVKTPQGHRRGPFVLTNNVSTTAYGTTLGAAWTFIRVDGLTIHGNEIQLQQNRNMHIAGLRDVTDVDIRDNEYPGGVGEYVILE